MMSDSILDLCGKRILDTVYEILSRFNHGETCVELRALGGNVSKGMEVISLLQTEFTGLEVGTCKVISLETEEGNRLSGIQVKLEGQPKPKLTGNEAAFDDHHFIQYPLYHLFFDWLLHQEGALKVLDQRGKLLCTIEQHESHKEYHKGDRALERQLEEALYRCGLLMPANWRTLAERLSRHDDVILGLDTNVLSNCNISEHILPLLSILGLRDYLHTPNWMLMAVPRAVLYELEAAANERDSRGMLTFIGRMGYRGLQEINKLSQGMDLLGVSLLVTGQANLLMDVRVEVEGLRKELSQFGGDVLEENGSTSRSSYRRLSSGDNIIREQFKQFLRQGDFSQHSHFLTGDKTNKALALAEGLGPLYVKSPADYFRSNNSLTGFSVRCIDAQGQREYVNFHVPLGRALYEMAVHASSITVQAGKHSFNLQCDTKGENLNHWLHKRLIADWNSMKKVYEGPMMLEKLEVKWTALADFFADENI